MKLKDLVDWTKVFGTGLFIALCIIFFPLTVFLSLVFKRAALEEFLEALTNED